MAGKIKVLFITSKLQHYRIPILNLIAKNPNIDLTVAHSSKALDDGSFLFNELILNEKFIKPFTYHKGAFITLCKSFDVVVSMFYLQKLSLMSLLLYKNKFKLIYWGIGVKASQTSKYDSKTILNRVRYYIASKSDAMLFYTDYAVQKYINHGINPDKLFTMPNTVRVLDNRLIDSLGKDSIIFFGTMNKSKRIFDLLEAYKSCAISENNKLPLLKIYGNGIEYESVKNWINENNFKNKIFLEGPVYKEEEKMKIFNKAIACISPGQAGLSVLTSFGYGVPFITSKDAITGGERLNIKNNINGKLFKSQEELAKIIIDIARNPTKYIEMGNNARCFYYNFRSPQIMADSFVNAVEYTIKNKNK